MQAQFLTPIQDIQALTPGSFVVVLESFETYGLAIKFSYALCYRAFLFPDGKFNEYLVRLKKHFLRWTERKTRRGVERGYTLSGKWYSVFGEISRTIYDKHGLIKKEENRIQFDQPNAVLIGPKPYKVEYYANGKIKSKRWAHNDGWFVTDYHKNGSLSRKVWMNEDENPYRYSEKHELAAKILYNTQGCIKEKYIHIKIAKSENASASTMVRSNQKNNTMRMGGMTELIPFGIKMDKSNSNSVINTENMFGTKNGGKMEQLKAIQIATTEYCGTKMETFQVNRQIKYAIGSTKTVT